MNKVHFSNNKTEWGTPQPFFDELNKRFHFALDVCALPENAKCEDYFTPEVNGLAQDWYGICWMNPPYGKEIAAWIQKAYEESRKGVTVVCLLPARTDTRWFHDYCLPFGAITFLKGRLKFEEAPASAPFPSMLVIFYGENVTTGD